MDRLSILKNKGDQTLNRYNIKEIRNTMATKVIKESNVRDIFKDRQVTTEAIQCIDKWVEKNLLAISQGLADNARITDVDIDLYITTKLLNDSTWTTARDIFLTKMIEYKSAEEK